MDEEQELQQALLLSLGHASGASVSSTSAVIGQTDIASPIDIDDNEANMQAAILLSTLGVCQAPEPVRKLLGVVAGNLRRTLVGTGSCTSEELVKFRQLSDEAVRKRTHGVADSDVAYEVAARVLRALGFELTHVAGMNDGDAVAGVARWVLPVDAAPPAEVLLDELAPLAEAAKKPHADGALAASDTSSALAALPRPHSMSSFDVSELGSCGGFGPLRVLVYPKGHTQIVGPADCVAWAASTGSGVRHWGSYGRRGDDDRVIFTLACNFGGRNGGCCAHWYDHRGDERTQPTMHCSSGEWRWSNTHVNQTFVVRMVPQMQIALLGIKLTYRPYDTRGHVVVMVTDAAIGEEGNPEVMQQFSQVIASLPEDDRDEPEQRQGGRPAPPPPSSKNRRGPWG